MKDYQAPANLLEGRVILITGASGGIGGALAKTCAKLGATVVLHGKRVKALERLYDEIEAAGGPTPAILPLDLATASEQEYNYAVSVLERQLKRLDGIVHCAAHCGDLSPMSNETIDAWQTMMRVNVIAPFALTKACLPLLMNSPDASVIVTSESHASQPSAYWGAFAASRAALEHAALGWADEWSRHEHLRVNVLVPGPVQSPARRRTHPAESQIGMATIDSLLPAYLYLLGAEGKGVRGQKIHLAQAGLAL